MKRVYKIDRNELNSHNSNGSNPNPDYFLSKDQCHRCKTLGVFICEHDTPYRDNIRNVYAEEGRYYMSPRKFSGADYGDSLRSYSGLRRSNTGYLTRGDNSGKNYPRIFLSNGLQKNNATNNSLKNKQVVVTTEKKKSAGCCTIS